VLRNACLCFTNVIEIKVLGSGIGFIARFRVDDHCRGPPGATRWCDMDATRLSRAAQHFGEEIDVVLAPISDRFVCLDTIQALLPRWLPTPDLSELARLNPGASIFERRRFGDCPVGDLPVRVRLHQPSEDALRFLHHVVPDHILNRADFALDLVVPSWPAASELRVFMHQYMTQPWRGKRTMTSVGDTVYYAPAWKRRNIVLYESRRLESSSRPALHIEFRFTGASVCRDQGGFESTIDESTIDLIGFDPRFLMLRSFRFSKIDWNKFDRHFDRFASLTMRNHGVDREYAIGRIREILRRAMMNHEVSWTPTPLPLTELPVQRWVDQLRRFKGAWASIIPKVLMCAQPHQLLQYVQLLPPLIKVNNSLIR
jgi:hypothetical protein